VSDHISAKQMDQYDEMAREQEVEAIRNASNQSPSYLMQLFYIRCVKWRSPVPVRPGVIAEDEAPLYAASRHRTGPQDHDVRAWRSDHGLIVTCVDRNGRFGDYYLENNGRNGVVIVGKVE
jgi:hypothetical protein